MADDAGGAWWRDAGIAARLVAVGVIIRAFEARILTRTAAPGMVLVSIRAELLRAYVKGAMPAGAALAVCPATVAPLRVPTLVDRQLSTTYNPSITTTHLGCDACRWPISFVNVHRATVPSVLAPRSFPEAAR